MVYFNYDWLTRVRAPRVEINLRSRHFVQLFRTFFAPQDFSSQTLSWFHPRLNCLSAVIHPSCPSPNRKRTSRCSYVFGQQVESCEWYCHLHHGWRRDSIQHHRSHPNYYIHCYLTELLQSPGRNRHMSLRCPQVSGADSLSHASVIAFDHLTC